MSTEIKTLKPQAVWEYFYDLTQIPRPTGQMDEVTKYVFDFGKRLGLETEQDEVGNVIIRKPATPGMENKPIVTLQSHLDMVPQKNSDIDHDFTKDPIDAYIDGEWVKARGTTLGAITVSEWLMPWRLWQTQCSNMVRWKLFSLLMKKWEWTVPMVSSPGSLVVTSCSI